MDLYAEEILDHYKRVIDACWTRNIQPMATFHHFTNPRWFAERSAASSECKCAKSCTSTSRWKV